MEVRPPRPREAAAALDLVVAHFGSTEVVSRGRLHDVAHLPCLIAVLRHTPLGALHYRVDGEAAEIVSLVATPKRRGTGRTLVRAARTRLSGDGVTRLWLVTTNDNVPAQAFYEAQGFVRICVHRDAVAQARRLKPSIPATGHGGTPIEHEIEYALDLTRDSAPAGT